MQQTKENIEKVTKEDVRRVANKYLQPDKVRILVVGNVEDFDEPLSVLSTVNEIDITIPTPKEEMPEATPESLAKGWKSSRRLLQLVEDKKHTLLLKIML